MMLYSVRATVIAVWVLTAAVEVQAQTFHVYVAPAMTKLKADRPEQVKSDRTIAIAAARNEFESFQLALKGQLSGVTASARAFVKQTGSSPILPSTRLFREDLITLPPKCTDPDPNSPGGCRGKFAGSSIDSTMDRNATGDAVQTRLPDPLVPDVDEVIGAARSAFNSFNVLAGEVRAIWVDVFVPLTTAPGKYTGTIDVSWSGGSEAITYTLEVWNFDLPSTPTLKSMTSVHFWALPHAHPNIYNADGTINAVRHAKVRARYTQLALDHRLSLGLDGMDDGADVNDLTHFDTYYGPSFNAGIGYHPAYDTASIGTQLSGAHLTALKPRGTLSTWASHFSADKDRLFFYTCNEPPKYASDAHKTMQAPEICGDKGNGWNWIPPLALPATTANIRSLVTTNITFATNKNVKSAVDVFTPIVNHMDVKSTDTGSGLSAGEHQGDYITWLGGSSNTSFPRELWIYQSCMSHACNPVPFLNDLYTGWPSYMIDADPIRARALEWLSFRYGAKGELYYEAADNFTNQVTFAANDPWSDQWNAAFGGFGEGTLFYPGTPSRIGGVSSDIADIPIASIRLKMIREGMEDYEYMQKVSTLSGDGGAWAKSLVRNVFPKAYDTDEPAVSGDSDQRPKSARLMDYRSQIAQRIREWTPNGLVLSDIQSPSQGATTATVTWTSDLDADSRVEYGTTFGNYPYMSDLDTALVPKHKVIINQNLSPSTTYYYRVRSNSARGVLTVAGDSTTYFTTRPQNIPAPVLTGIPSAVPDVEQAVISWTTNPDGDSVVFYGTTSGNYPNSVSDPTSTTTHSVTLKNLEPATQYFYKVQSGNAGGTMPLSNEATFTSLPPTAPAISNVAVPNINKSEATVTWSTTPSGTSQVKYGTTSGSYPNQTTPDTNRNTSHTVSLTALSPGTKYYFIVLSGNAGGSNTSLESNFTTLPDPPPPPVGGSSVGNFTDGFTSYDPSKWTFSTSAAGDSADDYAGVLRLTPAASTGTAGVNVDSLAQWSLIGSSVSVGVLQVVANNGGVNCKFNFHVPGPQAFNQTLGFWYEWGNLYAYYYVDGVQYSAAALTYSPVNHAWWRLRETSGTIFWDTSADGVSWGAPVAQIPTSTLHFDLTHGIVGFNVKAYGSGNSSPGSAQFANLNIAPPPLSTLLDPLLSVNTNLWYVEQDTPGSTVTVGNGVASLSPEPGSGIGGSGLIGVKTYSLTGSSISVRVPQVVTNGPNVDQVLRIAPGPFDFKRSVGFWYQQGILSAYQEVNETPTAVATLTYSPMTHAYWRIRESAGTVYWDTSSNGTTWTNQGTAPVSGLSFSPSSVSVYFTAKEWATGNANPGTGQFTKLNQ